MAHTSKQMEVIDWMNRFPFNESDFAKVCKVAPSTMNYQINNAVEIADKYYLKIKEMLVSNKHLSDQDECQELFDLTSDFFSSMMTQFTLYKNEVMRTIKNKKVEIHERPRLKTKLDDFRSKLNDGCNEIEKRFGL